MVKVMSDQDIENVNRSESHKNIIILELLADLRRTERELAEAVAYVTSNRADEEELETVAYYEQEEIPRLRHRIEDINAVILAFQ